MKVKLGKILFIVFALIMVSGCSMISHSSERSKVIKLNNSEGFDVSEHKILKIRGYIIYVKKSSKNNFFYDELYDTDLKGSTRYKVLEYFSREIGKGKVRIFNEEEGIMLDQVIMCKYKYHKSPKNAGKGIMFKDPKGNVLIIHHPYFKS